MAPREPVGFRKLADELIALFGRGVEAPLPDEAFDELARRAFRWQTTHNPVYAAFCRGRGVDPDGEPEWTRIPPVPTRAFKRLPLLSGPEEDVGAVFRTSGTSRGSGVRGEHRVLDPGLYRASLLPNFRAYLLPDGARLPLVSLIPSPTAAPDSSLSYMMGVVAAELCDQGGGWFVDREAGLLRPELEATLDGLEEKGSPVLLAATAFALVHWLDALEEDGRRFRLPPGSRLMETGGFKGQSRTLAPDELYARVEEFLEIPPSAVVNEYGMTELLSQFYQPVMRKDGRGDDHDLRRHVPPPWVRTRVLDPVTLNPVPPGREGLLCHFDLANLGTVCSILTEDLGVAVDDGFRVLGRARDAEPRGCSLAMDELLGAAGEARTT